MRLWAAYQALARRGIVVTAHGDQLHVAAPAGELTHADLQALRDRRAVWLALLRAPCAHEPAVPCLDCGAPLPWPVARYCARCSTQRQADWYRLAGGHSW